MTPKESFRETEHPTFQNLDRSTKLGLRTPSPWRHSPGTGDPQTLHSQGPARKDLDTCGTPKAPAKTRISRSSKRALTDEQPARHHAKPSRRRPQLVGLLCCLALSLLAQTTVAGLQPVHQDTEHCTKDEQAPITNMAGGMLFLEMVLQDTVWTIKYKVGPDKSECMQFATTNCSACSFQGKTSTSQGCNKESMLELTESTSDLTCLEAGTNDGPGWYTPLSGWSGKSTRAVCMHFADFFSRECICNNNTPQQALPAARLHAPMLPSLRREHKCVMGNAPAHASEWMQKRNPDDQMYATCNLDTHAGYGTDCSHWACTCPKGSALKLDMTLQADQFRILAGPTWKSSANMLLLSPTSECWTPREKHDNMTSTAAVFSIGDASRMAPTSALFLAQVQARMEVYLEPHHCMHHTAPSLLHKVQPARRQQAQRGLAPT